MPEKDSERLSSNPVGHERTPAGYEPAEHLIVLIHGIRTRAAWAEMVASTLVKDLKVPVQPIRYEYFDIFRFLFPFGTRKGPIKRILRELRDIRTQHPTAKVSVIAHSFGTYALAKCLLEPDVLLHRIIFCGSIVPDNFRRAVFRAQLSNDPILNDCGTADILPVLARSVTWGYGATGTFGFGTAGIRDRFNRFSHSEFFQKDYVRKFWVPFLKDGTIEDSVIEETRPAPPYWHSILATLPLKWMILGAMLFLLALPFYFRPGAPDTRLEFSGTRLRVGHLVGSPNLVLGLKFTHVGQATQTLTLDAVSLRAPDGVSYQLDFEASVVDAPHEFCMKVGLYSAPLSWTSNVPGENRFSVSYLSFRNDLRNFMITIHEELGKSGYVMTCRPSTSQRMMDESLATRLSERATNDWFWTTGEWHFVLAYRINDIPKSLRGAFVLTQSDLDCMKDVVGKYRYGVGVFNPWRFDLPSGVCAFVTKEIDATAVADGKS